MLLGLIRIIKLLQLHRHDFIRRVETGEGDYHSDENFLTISERASLVLPAPQ